MTHFRPSKMSIVAGLMALLVVSFGIQSSSAGPPLLAKNIREGDVRFKVTCGHDRSIPDDPIVLPGQPGAAHLHDFFGKKNVDAFTTAYGQLINGDDKTTCNDPQDLASYWVPALVTSDQGIVVPTRITAYYRRGSKNGLIGAYPDGLKVVAGWKAGAPVPSTEVIGWQCNDASQFREPLPPADCGKDHLHAYIRFPDCWDGVNVDSADHRSHMTYAVYDAAAMANVCPSTHRVQVPQLTIYVNYGTVRYGSTVTGLTSGGTETLHADFFSGWERPRLLERIDTCLNRLQRCASGG